MSPVQSRPPLVSILESTRGHIRTYEATSRRYEAGRLSSCSVVKRCILQRWAWVPQICPMFSLPRWGLWQ